ncbi:hypothetical protein SLA2020_060700 [Shorea laevis]
MYDEMKSASASDAPAEMSVSSAAVESHVGSGDEEMQFLSDAIRSLPSYAVKDLLSVGVCFKWRDDKETLVKKESANDMTELIAEIVKQEGHRIDSFCLDVSVPQAILENESAILSDMKRKYGSELWFRAKSLSELKFAVVTPLESLLVGVKNLKVVGSEGWTLMCEGESEKQQYAALVRISCPLDDKDLKTISSLKDMREKLIHLTKIERIAGSSQYFLLYLCTQAGTYIKEFVHGDIGRTHPSVGSILGCRAEIRQLDVTDVKMDCFLTG